jgi:hypothetical protein
VVIGLRNSKTVSRRSRSSNSKLNHNDKGSLCSHTGGMNWARAASRRSCAQSCPTTIAANASPCASRSAMLPECDAHVLASADESSPSSTRPPSPHRPCVPGDALIPGFVVAGSLVAHNKSYSAAPIAGHREVYDQNRHDAAFRGNRDSPFGPPPWPNPHRLSKAIGVAVDPPDGSGTKSLHF